MVRALICHPLKMLHRASASVRATVLPTLSRTLARGLATATDEVSWTEKPSRTPTVRSTSSLLAEAGEDRFVRSAPQAGRQGTQSRSVDRAPHVSAPHSFFAFK